MSSMNEEKRHSSTSKSQAQLYQELLVKSNNRPFTSIQQLIYQEDGDQELLEELANQQLIKNHKSFMFNTSLLYKFGISLYDIQNSSPCIQEWICIAAVNADKSISLVANLNFIDYHYSNFNSDIFAVSPKLIRKGGGCQRYCSLPEVSGYWCDNCSGDRIGNLKRLFKKDIKLSDFKEECILYIGRSKFTPIGFVDKKTLHNYLQDIEHHFNTVTSADAAINELESLIKSLSEKKQERTKLLVNLGFTVDDMTSTITMVNERILQIEKQEKLEELRTRLRTLQTTNKIEEVALEVQIAQLELVVHTV